MIAAIGLGRGALIGWAVSRDLDLPASLPADISSWSPPPRSPAASSPRPLPARAARVDVLRGSVSE
jgi:hypothetical protein